MSIDLAERLGWRFPRYERDLAHSCCCVCAPTVPWSGRSRDFPFRSCLAIMVRSLIIVGFRKQETMTNWDVGQFHYITGVVASARLRNVVAGLGSRIEILGLRHSRLITLSASASRVSSLPREVLMGPARLHSTARRMGLNHKRVASTTSACSSRLGISSMNTKVTTPRYHTLVEWITSIASLYSRLRPRVRVTCCEYLVSLSHDIHHMQAQAQAQRLPRSPR